VYLISCAGMGNLTPNVGMVEPGRAQIARGAAGRGSRDEDRGVEIKSSACGAVGGGLIRVSASGEWERGDLRE
jgi:hypothetical protein